MVNVVHRMIGSHLMNSIAGGMRKVSGNLIPQWNPWIPKGAKYEKFTSAVISEGINASDRAVVYFPSCINRSMGI
jgi:D-lactate dehydrogenase